MRSFLQPFAGAKELIRLGAFLLFVALGVSIWYATGPARRGAILRLIAYVVAITVLVGFTQIESWPFTNWALVHTISRAKMNRWELIGVDGAGRRFEIDPQAIQPFGMEEFDTWMRRDFFRVDAGGRLEVARWIIDRAEEARERYLKRGRIGTDGWLLSEAAAPHHFTRGLVWRSPRDVPSDRFVRLEIWFSEWDV